VCDWQRGCDGERRRKEALRLGHGMDAQQGDGIAGGSGIRRGRAVWARSVGKFGGGGANGDGHCIGRAGRVHRAEEENGDADRGAAGHPGRPDDRERVLHLFCGGGDGVAVAASVLFCARGGDGLFARTGDEGRAIVDGSSLGRRSAAEDVVGAGAGGFAMEQRIVRGDEVPVLLLFGIGTGADARARSADGANDGRRACVDSNGGACADVDDGSVLFAARIAGAGGGMEIHFEQCATGAGSEEDYAGGDVNERGGGREVREVEEKRERAAAFFDLDGTLVAGTSLEREFFRELRWRGAIPVRNYFFWLKEAARLAPRGIAEIANANKMYLRGVGTELAETIAAKRGPRFYREGLERVEWHVRQGHAIYLVSGTLEGLASNVGLALVARLAMRGVTARIGFCATRLEEDCGRWTGTISGEAMFGEAKARAMGRIAKQEGFSLEKSYAYGNSMSDRWMLAAVGKATAVNPSGELESVARLRGWAVMNWEEEEKGEGSLTRRFKGYGEMKKQEMRNAELRKRSVSGAGCEDELRIGRLG
jgi:HAD superfamily hydrolase (TIGR01490 family)